MTQRRKTKIVATLGPSSSEEGQIAALVEAGVDVFRINCSHGNTGIRTRWMGAVRAVASRAQRPVALLVDLMGPRIRVGSLPEPMELVEGREVVFAPEAVAAQGEIPVTYRELANDVVPGSRVLLADGVLDTEVLEVEPPRVRVRIRHGGTLESRKGINLPGVRVSAPPLTEKDLVDVDHAVEHGADLIALSFVRKAQDMEALRHRVPEHVQLIAKIEKDLAVAEIDGILESSDGVMVARGDLGVELPFEEVPLVQKRLIRFSNDHAKPVITATQMLESMVHHPRPTRAEASDVANAILDGTDAVMLSAETAVGEFPVESVRAMDRIIRAVEARPDAKVVRGARHRDPVLAEDAIAFATTAAAEMLEAPLIVTFTKGGFTARKVAAYRPGAPILGLTTDRHTYHQLALVWGVDPLLVDSVPNYDAMLEVARDAILRNGYASPGDRIVVTAGLPWEVSLTTNLLKVETV